MIEYKKIAVNKPSAVNKLAVNSYVKQRVDPDKRRAYMRAYMSRRRKKMKED